MLVFRKPGMEDAARIAELHALSWQLHYRGEFSDYFLDSQVFADRMEVWKERFQKPDPSQRIVLAELDGRLVGFACAFLDENTSYGTLIDNLHVSSESQGLGIGRKLMAETAKESAKVHPNNGLYLWVLDQNKRAIDFYENLGGKKMETIEEYSVGDRVVMKRRYVWPTAGILTERTNLNTN
jgi:ribosomal protein S18 acetylase RimI-like enzyme